MKIIRIITVVLFMLSATATVNAAVLDKAPTSFVIKLQVPPPPPHPPALHIKAPPAPPRPVVRGRVTVRRPPPPPARRRLHIKLPHIKLPPHPPGPPGAPPRPF